MAFHRIHFLANETPSSKSLNHFEMKNEEMKNSAILSICLLAIFFVACGGSTSSGDQAANAPEDPASIPVVQGLDTVEAEYDKGIASVIPGYLAISWFDLSDVEFEDRFYEEVKSYLLFPKFGDRVKRIENKRVTLAGYTITADADSGIYVLSANPLASCFFCGAAGPESVVQLNLIEGQREFETDEWITFKGKLRLNDSNINELNYILEEAEEVKE
jgi:hypothetical protein